MAQPTSRFRTDLIDVAWEMEDDYGQPPMSNRMGQMADTTKGRLCRQWGLVTGGVTLPNPRYEWNPYFGIGVDDRNMTMAVRGRQTLEGSVPTIMLCHDTSRYALEMCMGLMFNYDNKFTGGPTNDSNTGTTASHLTVTSTRWQVTSMDYSSHKPATLHVPPKAILIVGEGTNAVTAGNVNLWNDTWAYIGPGGGNHQIDVYRDVGLNHAGWNGKIPASQIAQNRYRISSVERATIGASAASNNGAPSGGSSGFVDNGENDDNRVVLRSTLTQPSFTIAANFNADDGSRFTTNYHGNKISRTTLTFAEGEPVTFSWDFTGQDMSHNIGQDDGTGSTAKILKYMTAFTEAEHTTALNTTANVADEAAGLAGGRVVEAGDMSVLRVNEQPYFFSGALIEFKGTPFARFRNFAISIDNALDPRWYISQNSAGTPDSNRQIISEILEGRRTITFTGSLDVDSTGDATPTDAVFLQWLLNQGVHSSDDVRDMSPLQGVEITITLERLADASDAAQTYDRMYIKLPAPNTGKLSNSSGGGSGSQTNLGAAGEVGLILRSSSLNIAGPPQVHQAMDIDGFAASIGMWFEDNAS